MPVHEVAATGFDREATVYERARPGYPPDAVAWLAGHLWIGPAGRLGLVWNARDRSVDYVDRLWSIMDQVERRAPWREHEEWHESAFTETPWFGPLHEATFHHEQTLTVDDVVARFQSVSHVAVLPAAERDAVLAEVRQVLATHPDTRGVDTIAIPYRVDAYWCERAPR